MATRKPADRRLPDPRLEKLVNEMGTVQIKLETNTALTQKAVERADAAAVKAEAMAADVKDVKDILTTFRVAGTVAKWLAGVAAAVVAIKTGWHSLITR